MSIIRWNPNWDPFEEMEAMMNRLPSFPANAGMQKGFIPAMDVYEEKNDHRYYFTGSLSDRFKYIRFHTTKNGG